MSIERFTPTPPRADKDVDLTWRICGGSFLDYMDDFSVDRNFTAIIHGHLEYLATKRLPVVIDVMAPAESLVQLSDYLQQPLRGLSVSLTDYREDWRVEYDRDMYGVEHLAGNITDKRTWARINMWRALSRLKGQGNVDLIMERAYGGFSYIPTTREFFCTSIARLWHMLGEGGMLWLQTPALDEMEKRDIPATEWLAEVDRSGIDVKFKEPKNPKRDTKLKYGYLLMKKADSRQKLPVM